ncbi:uncharacterized protein EI90DRAFT_3020697 [Cantharellus anzutake]|uniref:uncharacterized protein n=1 Tax=Cantharellus anzutake TaxID=1750568 RepID=UPI001905C887|nr:uncharacterized protein EI90DRAFT_3020697 [Cantharellus anzutake]KAF8319838.1 hypothetical protein EI90DRAFT_3020697 [Cantharellus anzutake]
MNVLGLDRAMPPHPEEHSSQDELFEQESASGYESYGERWCKDADQEVESKRIHEESYTRIERETRRGKDIRLELKRTIPREVPLSVKEYVEELYKEMGDENVWNLLPRTPNGPGEFHPYRFYPPGDCIGLETGISEQRPKIFYIHESETEEEFEEECWPEAED